MKITAILFLISISSIIFTMQAHSIKILHEKQIHSRKINAIDWDPNCEYNITSCSNDGKVIIWHQKDPEVLYDEEQLWDVISISAYSLPVPITNIKYSQSQPDTLLYSTKHSKTTQFNYKTNTFGPAIERIPIIKQNPNNENEFAQKLCNTITIFKDTGDSTILSTYAQIIDFS